MSDSLSMKITKLLMSERPGLLACDPGDVGEVTGTLADVLGSMLAIVRETKGEATYVSCLKHLAQKIDESARVTREIAQLEADKLPPVQ